MPLGDVEQGATVRILRFENEAEDLLHYLKDSGIEPGLEGAVTEVDDEHMVVDARRAAVRDQPLGRRDGVGDRRPVAAARTALPEQLVLSKDRYGR